MKTQSTALYVLRLAVTLLLITGVMAALLAGVNVITKPIIEKIQEEKTQKAIEAVLPGGGEAIEFDAAANPNVTAHVYDIRHFENLKNQYNVMSVPCMVLNNQSVFFGKKNIGQILSLLK